MENKTPLEKIQEICLWYRNKRDWSPGDLETLLNAARRIATEIFFFADEVGDMAHDKTGTEYRRKSEFAKTKERLIAERHKKEEKVVANLIENEALSAIDDYLKQEALAESTYQKAKMLLDTAREVHSQMNQHISYFKTEKRLENSAQGSQHT